MPSPISMMESTGILKRAQIGRDAQQGVTQTFVPISPSVPCSVQPASDTVALLYQQRNTQVNTVVYLAENIQAQVNDKFTVTSLLQKKTKDLLVRGFPQQVDRDVIWRMVAWEEPPPAKPTTVTFVVSAPDQVQTGTQFTFTVTAVDAMGNTVTGYAGTVQFFCFGDPLATLPIPATLFNGTGTFPATLVTLGTQTILAQDTSAFSIYGTSNEIDVTTDPATNFAGSAINFGGSQNQFAGAT